MRVWEKPSEYGGTIHVEMADNFRDIVSTIESRKPVKSHQDTWEEDGYSWSGYSDKKTARQHIREGMEKEKVRKFNDIADNMETMDVPKLSNQIWSVNGSSVSVPRYTMGIPRCVRKREFTPVKSKDINIVLDAEATCDVSAEAMQTTLEDVFCMLVSLQNAGYRTRLYSCVTLQSNADDTRYILAVPIKKQGWSMELNRIAHMCTVEFFRYMYFSWMCRLDHPKGLGYGLGTTVRNDAKREELYAQVYGSSNFVGLWVDQLARMNEHDRRMSIRQACLKV